MKKIIARPISSSKIKSCINKILCHSNSFTIEEPRRIAQVFVDNDWNIDIFLDGISVILQREGDIERPIISIDVNKNIKFMGYQYRKTQEDSTVEEGFLDKEGMITHYIPDNLLKNSLLNMAYWITCPDLFFGKRLETEGDKVMEYSYRYLSESGKVELVKSETREGDKVIEDSYRYLSELEKMKLVKSETREGDKVIEVSEYIKELDRLEVVERKDFTNIQDQETPIYYKLGFDAKKGKMVILSVEIDSDLCKFDVVDGEWLIRIARMVDPKSTFGMEGLLHVNENCINLELEESFGNINEYVPTFIKLLTGIDDVGSNPVYTKTLIDNFIKQQSACGEYAPIYYQSVITIWNNLLNPANNIRLTKTFNDEVYDKLLKNEVYIQVSICEHALTLKLFYNKENSQLIVSVYNSGDGLEHHDSKMFAKKNHTCTQQKYKTEKRYIKEIKDHAMLKAVLDDLLDCKDKKLTVNGLYEYCDREFISDSTHRSFTYQKDQKSGNCSLETLMATLNNNLTLEEYIQFRIDLAEWLKNQPSDISEMMKSKLQEQVNNRTHKLAKVQEWSAVIKNDPPDTDQILRLFEDCNSRERYQCMRLALEINDTERREFVFGLLKRNLTEED